MFWRRKGQGRRSRQQSQSDLPDNADLTHLDDESLVGLVIQGRSVAFDILYARYAREVFLIARRILGNDDEAEDTMQQVFLEIFRSCSAFNPGKASFRTWLWRRAYHRSLTRRKHLEAQLFYTLQSLDETLPACETSPELLAQVEELFSRLSPRKREIISLRVFEGLTPDEIVKRTGYTVATVRHELYRGLAELRRAYRHARQPEPEDGARSKSEKRTV